MMEERVNADRRAMETRLSEEKFEVGYHFVRSLSPEKRQTVEALLNQL